MRKIIKYVIFALLFLSLSVLVAFLIYVHFFRPDEQDLSGEWTADLDMTKQAAVTAFIWLQDIEAVSVSLEDMESRMQGLTVEVNITFEQTDQSEGAFRCGVETESYDACDRAAYEAFAAAFRELLAARLSMAGYTGGTDEAAVEALVVETFGMDTISYLRACAPALLPSLEEMQAQYDGKGTYETADGILIRRFDEKEGAAAKEEYYIRKDSRLILSGGAGTDSSDFDSGHYPVIYTLKQK